MLWIAVRELARIMGHFKKRGPAIFQARVNMNVRDGVEVSCMNTNARTHRVIIITGSLSLRSQAHVKALIQLVMDYWQSVHLLHKLIMRLDVG